MNVALWSAAPALGNVQANVQTVAAACKGGLVVFPELFLTGYNIGDDVQRLAFKDEDPRLQPLRDACRATKTHLVVGAPYTPRAGLTYNAALCIDDEGAITWVKKRALPTFTTFQEGLFFANGMDQPVWHTKLGAIGVGICYDLYFPEFHKEQVLMGADILLNISASPSISKRFFETLLPARAVENAVFMLYSNNVGAQDGIMFWGGAQAYGPRGDLLAKQPDFEDGVQELELNLNDLQAAREFRPTIRDS
ncbi:MAG: carbon-nitrogen hydrolase family protein [Thermoplasmatota archaeon]